MLLLTYVHYPSVATALQSSAICIMCRLSVVIVVCETTGYCDKKPEDGTTRFSLQSSSVTYFLHDMFDHETRRDTSDKIFGLTSVLTFIDV